MEINIKRLTKDYGRIRALDGVSLHVHGGMFGHYIVPVTSEPDPLDGTRWELAAFERAEGAPSLPEQARFFVEFQQGEVSLRGGCNSIVGHCGKFEELAK